MTSENLYRKLQQHLDRMPVAFPATESGVEIRILRKLFTPEQAELALQVSAIPEPAATIHHRFGSKRTLEEVSAMLETMAANGAVLKRDSYGGPRYSKMIFAVGMFERQLNRLTPDFVNDADQYLREEFGRAYHTGGTPQMRTVPVNKTIAVNHGVATHDDIREYVKAAPGPFAKMDCICRRGQDLVGHSCGQTSVRENCLTVGPAADMMVDVGQARFVSREEMLDLLDLADKEGLVLQAENTKHPMFVCCCCGCCCAVLKSAKQLPNPADYFSANYYAEADAALCENCGTCSERCQMEAIAYDNGAAQVDKSRCIGCGLCVTTCPSSALQMKNHDANRTPPDSTRSLYMQLLQERYGTWGTAKLAGRKLFGAKI